MYGRCGYMDMTGCWDILLISLRSFMVCYWRADSGYQSGDILPTNLYPSPKDDQYVLPALCRVPAIQTDSRHSDRQADRHTIRYTTPHYTATALLYIYT